MEPAEIGRLLHLLRRPDATPAELVRFYVGYTGKLQFGLQRRWFERLAAAGAATRLRDALDEHGAVTPALLAAHAPDLAGAYPRAVATPTVATLLPASANALYSDALPEPIGRKSRLRERPAYRLLRQDGMALLVTPHAHMAFSADATFAPALSSRALPLAAAAAPVRVVDRPVVLIRDRFPDGNFAHVLFDGLPRLLHFAVAEPDAARRALYVMAGRADALQTLLIDLLGLPRDAFLHVEAPVVLQAPLGIWGFSDHADKLHPMNLVHPESLALVRGLLMRLPIAPSAAKRIYVSRRDAKSRRVANEAALAGLLLRRGYATVALGELALADQIAVMAGAEAIVGPHGMGFAHLLWHRGAPTVLELFNAERGTDAYALIARGMGFEHRFLLGGKQPGDTEDFCVDPDRLAAALP